MLKWMKSLLSFQNAATKDYIIVGLGNPGKAYEKTRHNVGFRAVRYFAKQHSIRLKQAKKMCAEVGVGKVGASTVRVILPLTYMNSSGEAVKQALKAWKVPPSRLSIVVDDIAFEVGEIRFKKEGSAGGHNGLKSVEEHIGSSQFARLRIGIGHPHSTGAQLNLADFVLSNFEAEEEKKLTSVFHQVSEVLKEWILKGIEPAMTLANTKKE